MRDHYERMHQANSMRRQRNLALEQNLGTLQKENADLCFQLQRAEVGGCGVCATALPQLLSSWAHKVGIVLV